MCDFVIILFRMIPFNRNTVLPASDADLRIRTVMIGDSDVGKSSILKAFVGVSKSSGPTIGIECSNLIYDY
jgi:GTPase SAR1 family protein